MRKMRPAVLGVTLLGLGVLGLHACGKKQISADIKVGLIAELTGDIPAVGASCKDAAEMAVSEVADADGLVFGGKRHGVRLLIEDSSAKADQAATAAQKLIDQDEVLAIVGPNASLGAVPASQIAESGKTPLITPWSTNPKTTMDPATGKPKRYVFRACFTDPFEGHVLATFAHDYMKAEKAAVLYDVASEAPKSQAELFRKDFEKQGGKIVSFETYSTGDKDFSAQLTKIKSASPDLVFLPSYYNDVPLQLQQAHRLGLKVPFLGSDSWSSPELVKLSGADAEGAYFCNHYSPGAKNETTGRFVVAYKKRFGHEPDDVAALTYDALGVLFKAIVAAGKIEREAVRDSLGLITDYEGVTGRMKFKEGSGDPTKSAVMMKVQGGSFVWVTNVDP